MTNNINALKEKMLDPALPLGGFTGDEEFYLEYVESLTEGDIRPIVIKNYVEENE